MYDFQASVKEDVQETALRRFFFKLFQDVKNFIEIQKSKGNRRRYNACFGKVETSL